MEYQKVANLLSTTSDNVPRFITEKCEEVHDQLGNDRYNPSKQIRFKTSMLRSYLCDFSDGILLLKELLPLRIQIIMCMTKKLAFKNNAPFFSWVSKISNTFIDNAEDLDIVMPMYNLPEYNKNCSRTRKFLELLQRWTK